MSNIVQRPVMHARMRMTCAQPHLKRNRYMYATSFWTHAYPVPYPEVPRRTQIQQEALCFNHGPPAQAICSTTTLPKAVAQCTCIPGRTCTSWARVSATTVCCLQARSWDRKQSKAIEKVWGGVSHMSDTRNITQSLTSYFENLCFIQIEACAAHLPCYY